MENNDYTLPDLIQEIALQMQTDTAVDAMYYAKILRDPWLATQIVDLLCAIDESTLEQGDDHYYFACIFTLDLCISQLQSSSESGGNMHALQTLDQLMSQIAQIMPTHSLNFWMPVINIFYTSHIELSAKLKNAYMHLAHTDDH